MRWDNLRVQGGERRHGMGTRCSAFRLDVEGAAHGAFELQIEVSRARCRQRQRRTRASSPLSAQVRCCAVRSREACAFIQIVAASGRWG